ncbi:selenocysteine-specific translation elongation factor [Hydrogenophaga sp. PAMC20947]|uniref:selenocysteine-specific translation elongation factor n=1 Tax=Hydrogenophaga sp. PAMC20947 TaxID=2565558 RepID=UPI00109DB500|nr:selenocysteine-specific translation elongation factor [Hydrogenophaga sp. PAMC20947]QCB45861.1 selenocysteine-specific translation elongation factor [Hydrogenophaga sp. PAMC20947]
MIVATAGHVDHGKTTLVKALTGTDTDRLAEEKRRGMSIDLGFAYADFGSEWPIGFVDVPGHERFVRNMLAGVAAVDFALLVVAADDGPMPQTREHVAILDLLGIEQGAVAITKIDRVSPERLADVRVEIAALLARSALQGAPVFPIATPSGEGLAALRTHLTAADLAWTGRSTQGSFRLAVDRCFTIGGAGLVVTGAVFSGRVNLGDQLLISPQGTPVRVRSIHAQNRTTLFASAGQRCALNLVGTGLKRHEVQRGDWIVALMAHAPTARLDVRLSVLGSESRALTHWAPVHLHIGATALSARVATLGERSILAGSTGMAQLVLDQPISAMRGDRFILRDQSGQRTIAGGFVVDPFGVTRGRSKPARLAQLSAMELPSASDSLMALMAVTPEGVDLARFGQAWNLTTHELDSLLQGLEIQVIATASGRVAVAASQWASLGVAICAAVDAWHGEQADSLGPTDAELASQLSARNASAVFRAALKSLLTDGSLVREGLSMRRPGHRARLDADDVLLLERVSAILQAHGLRPPIVGELATTLNMESPRLLEFLLRVSALGHLVRIARNRFFLPSTVVALSELAATLAAQSADGMFDAAQYRDRSGIGRNLTVQVLEFLDRVAATKLIGERRAMQP